MIKQPLHRLYMGIDGGGTKTIGALADETGTILAECKAGPSSIVGVPSAESCAVLQSVRDNLCELAGARPDAIAWLGLGLNGVDFPEETIRQHGVLSRMLAVAPERFILVNDGIAALWGGDACARGCDCSARDRVHRGLSKRLRRGASFRQP